MSSSNDYKDIGNAYFMARNYSEAINCYTKAIIKCPDMPIYYTNRALCYLKLKQWDLACQDCQKAMELNPSHFKAHYLKGQALMELNYLDEAICSLSRAQELAKEQRQNVGDDIARVLRLARKKRWNEVEERRVVGESELQMELTQLLAAEKLKQVDLAQQLKNGDTSLLLSIENSYEEKITLLSQLFDEVDDKRKKRDVPDVLCCKINYGLMKDPVITPSGITYERKDIEEHLQRIGHFDPLSRKEMTESHLIPNLALKEVIANFVTDNPWAEDY